MLQAISEPGGSTSKSSHQQQPTLRDSWCHCQIWSREDEVAQHLWHRCVQGDGDGNDELEPTLININLIIAMVRFFHNNDYL